MNNEDLLPFYALDTLSDTENAQVEAWLANNPAAQAELAEFRQVTDQLATAIDPIVPTPSTKSALMQRIEADPRASIATPVQQQILQPKKRFWQKWGLSQPKTIFAAFSVAMAAFAILYAFNLRHTIDTLRQQNEQLSAEISQQQTTLTALETTTKTLSDQLASLDQKSADLQQINQELQARLDYESQVLAIFTAPKWETARLTGTENAQSSRGYVVLDPERDQAVLSVNNLDPLPDDLTYQLWLIKGDERISAGTFEITPADNGSSTYIFSAESLKPFDAIGISIEPAGGSEQPTGTTVMLASLNS